MAPVLDELFRPAPQGADGPVTSGSRQRRAERLLNQIGAYVGGPGNVHQADLLSTTTVKIYDLCRTYLFNAASMCYAETQHCNSLQDGT